MPISLYVHIPFCLNRCIYCDFVSGIYTQEKADAYLRALKGELLNIPSDKIFSSLYIGGGTPTSLSSDKLSELLSHIFTSHRFEGDYEATIEANPGTIDRDKLKIIRSSGLNRISIGIQSFNNKELAILGRVHSSEEAEQAVYHARESGFENIGIDLMYGIPGQDLSSWKETLKKAVSLNPKHISTYELTVEKGTLLYEYLNNPPLIPLLDKGGYRGVMNLSGGGKMERPSENIIIEMYNHVIDYLSAEGIVHYEISNFAKPGYFCRHNLNYWDREEYYGAGIGAHSFIEGRRLCNTSVLEDYIHLLSANKSPVIETEDISGSKAMFETIFLGLRRTKGINYRDFQEAYGQNFLTLYNKEISDLQEQGLIEHDGRNIRLSRKGLLLSNEVFMKFM
ncbi:MAG: radical SAM family heme chaperone HemW [Nitrospirae bacterium]|nr:radical SAM family heme chaperone HemW [Nitrospirota bacterium]